MAAPSQNIKHPTLDTFLAKHPEIVVGRDKIEKLRDETDVATNYNTFETTTKPFPNVVLVQCYLGDTNKRQWVAALVDDEKAESYYWEVVTKRKCELCLVQIEKEDPEKLLREVFEDFNIVPDHECKYHLSNEEEPVREMEERN